MSEPTRGTGSRLGGLALRGWRVRSDPSSPSHATGGVFELWARMSGAIACWPGARVAVERRFVNDPETGLVREYLLAAAEVAGSPGEHEWISTELEGLTRPVRSLQLMSPLDEEELSRLLDVKRVRDVAEIDELSDLAPEGAATLSSHLGELVDSLAHLPSRVALSILIATPTLLETCQEPSLAPLLASGPVWTIPAPSGGHRRPIRFRLRLAGEVILAPSILGLAGALALAPGQVGGEGWSRAAGAGELDGGRAQLRSLGVERWGGGSATEEAPASTVAAATVMALPAVSERLDRPDRALEPVEVPNESGAIIGEVATREGGLAEAGIAWADRRGHCYVAGATGTGKSTLLNALARHDMESGRALVVVDPHGPLADQILGLVPGSRRDDVVVLDPLDPKGAGLDLVPSGGDADPHRVASRVTDAIQALYDPETVGPRLLQVIQMSVLALLMSGDHRDAAPTIANLERLLSEADYRRWLIERIADPAVRAFWIQYERQSETSFHQAEFLMYATSKLTPLTQGTIRHAVAEPARYRLEDLIAERRIIVCRVPVGELGFAAASSLAG